MLEECLESTFDAIEKWTSGQHQTPVVGLILGTGMGPIANRIENKIAIPFEDLPHLSKSTVKGHRGELIFGQINDVPIVAMNGRFHFYEGYTVEQITFPIELICRMGISTLAVGNASGGLNPKYRSGEVMLIDDHIDLFFRPPAIRLNPLPGGTRLQPRLSAYSSELATFLKQTAARMNRVLHQGVYAALTGPNYETRSEYRFLRKIGADAVGMSTIPEIEIAAHHGVSAVGLSVITNTADPDICKPTTHGEVLDAVATAELTLVELVEALIGHVAQLPQQKKTGQ